MHTLEPPWLNVPAGQAKHSVERAVALYIPAGQSTHVLLVPYMPATQSVHAPAASETEPEAHCASAPGAAASTVRSHATFDTRIACAHSTGTD